MPLLQDRVAQESSNPPPPHPGHTSVRRTGGTSISIFDSAQQESACRVLTMAYASQRRTIARAAIDPASYCWLSLCVLCIGVMMSFANAASTILALPYVHVGGSTVVWVTNTNPHNQNNHEKLAYV